jgi:uncharacterized metal-binding protein
LNCTKCGDRSCRTLDACRATIPDDQIVMAQYHQAETQAIVQAAARLVDDGLAGTLARVQELERFILDRDYAKVGLAYCYGMEHEARQILQRLRGRGIRAVAISCTVGGLAQSEINEASLKPGVSCNPLSQAAQLEAEGVDLAVVVGLCLGHDILFTKAFSGDQTTLVVKDRVHRHRPLDALAEASRA